MAAKVLLTAVALTVGVGRAGAADPLPLLTPEPAAGVKPERRDAAAPVGVHPDPRHYAPHVPKPGGPTPVPVLPVRLPARVLGDLRFFCRGDPGPVAASPDGKLLALGAVRVPGVRLFDAATGKEVAALAGRQGAVTRLAFSPDSARLYSGNGGDTNRFVGRLIVRDVAAKQEVIAVPADDWSLTPGGHTLVTLEWVPDNPPAVNGIQLLVARFRPVVRVRDTRTWAEVAGYAVNGFPVSALAVSPDGNSLALGGQDGVVRTWDRAAGKELARLPTLTDAPVGVDPRYYRPSVARLVFDPAGKRLAGANRVATGNTIHQVAVWDWPAGTPARRWTLGTDHVTALAFAPDGKHLVASDGYEAAVWDPATGATRVRLNRDADKRAFGSVAFAPGGRVVTSGYGRPALAAFPSLAPLPISDPPPDDGPAKVPFELAEPLGPGPGEVRLPGGGSVRQLDGYADRENGFAQFNAAGKRVRVYESGRKGDFAVAPGGKLLATSAYPGDFAKPGADRERPVRFWDLATGNEVGTIRDYPEPDGELRFAPDGKSLAARHRDGLVRVWDVATRNPVLALDPDGYWPARLTFSKDGRFLVGGTAESPVLVVWDVTDPAAAKP